MAMDIPIELEENETEQKLLNGEITFECYGSENTYYLDAEKNAYFCKNYPQQEQS